MRKPRKRSFAELVSENKNQIMKDEALMEKIEKRLEAKRIERAE
ncbi:FbpB family small basic protein [Neobacillus notoginsengisoli]|uniref:FbpB family small basic protein n=1 Tax=Neobacillus notoginsengisoli TaxID=1578198 RepID=A0A417YX22_9BACI|nr:FbpB family small basic protein [Neobacillus notoginsengisoli]RHW42143.1 FbpB family small basic protein [Neobacillus notoginsengisoli]